MMRSRASPAASDVSGHTGRVRPKAQLRQRRAGLSLALDSPVSPGDAAAPSSHDRRRLARDRGLTRCWCKASQEAKTNRARRIPLLLWLLAPQHPSVQRDGVSMRSARRVLDRFILDRGRLAHGGPSARAPVVQVSLIVNALLAFERPLRNEEGLKCWLGVKIRPGEEKPRCSAQISSCWCWPRWRS